MILASCVWTKARAEMTEPFALYFAVSLSEKGQLTLQTSDRLIGSGLN